MRVKMLSGKLIPLHKQQDQPRHHTSPKSGRRLTNPSVTLPSIDSAIFLKADSMSSSSGVPRNAAVSLPPTENAKTSRYGTNLCSALPSRGRAKPDHTDQKENVNSS